jgi:hypothetical protein
VLDSEGFIEPAIVVGDPTRPANLVLPGLAPPKLAAQPPEHAEVDRARIPPWVSTRPCSVRISSRTILHALLSPYHQHPTLHSRFNTGRRQVGVHYFPCRVSTHGRVCRKGRFLRSYRSFASPLKALFNCRCQLTFLPSVLLVESGTV